MPDATTAQVEGPLGRTYLEVTLAVLALVTIVAFEAMAVSTAMPAVARDLDAVRSYGFAFSVMLTAQLLGIVLAGVWSDRSGPMVGAVTGQALLAAGAAMCGFATNLQVFLAGRALTGLGGGLLVVMLYVIAGRYYPEAIRPRLFTYVSAAWVLPALLGPPVSAWLTTNLTWRWVFWGVVPPVLLTLAALTHARTPHRRLHAHRRGQQPRPLRARADRVGGPGDRAVGRRPPARHLQAGAPALAEDGRCRGRPDRRRRLRAHARAPRDLANGARTARA